MTIDIDDQRTIGTEVAAKFGGALISIQQQAADALLANEIGVLVAPPAYLANAALGTSVGALLILPSLGHWYANHWITRSMIVRGLGLGAIALAVASDDPNNENINPVTTF